MHDESIKKKIKKKPFRDYNLILISLKYKLQKFLSQWFLTLLEVPNPTSFMCEFTEPFFSEK